MKNRYPQLYTQAYADFLGFAGFAGEADVVGKADGADGGMAARPDKVLFSRAGFAGVQTTPIHWAGDQKSTFAELRAQMKAALSASMSGMFFWAQDIGGFAGELPSADLYLRATQMAAFTSVMQWHSEPDGGQFAEVMASQDTSNERSPWNIARRSGDKHLLERTRFYHKLRARMLPELVQEAKESVRRNRPMMRPLAFDYMPDPQTHGIVDEYLFGENYLVAPVLTANTVERQVYLPAGQWEDFWTGERYEGGQTITFRHPWHMPVYKKSK
jgi:alpha-D-xyloside xylohydrolase